MQALNDALLAAQASHDAFLNLASSSSFARGSAKDEEEAKEEKAEEEDEDPIRAFAKKRFGSPTRPPPSASSTSASGSSRPPPSRLQPEAQPPRKHRRMVGEEELHDLRGEQSAAHELGLRWQDRGPPANSAMPGDTWRGQKLRVNSGKWANRGGAHKSWYSAYYVAKQAGPEAEATYLQANPHPKKGK